MNNHHISKKLGEHYSQSFERHGATSEGVDWGKDEERLFLRYEKMLSVIRRASHYADVEPIYPKHPPTILDVGCGYGGLLDYATSNGYSVDYAGVDISEDMISWANDNHSEAERFVSGDFMSMTFPERFDFVVCNGILTQKLDVPGGEMDVFALALIKKMYETCNVGVAFNVMTTKVNYFSNNLYYKNPVELFGWCMNELTAHVAIDHAYPLYEYTVYLYRDPQ